MNGPGQLKQIRSEVRDHTAVITLAHASRRNAINAEMVTEIVGVLDQIEASPEVSAVVITGEGPAFCAGAELGHLMRASAENDLATEALRTIYRVFLRIDACCLPTIAAVNGPAVGAGMNMALACDIRIAGHSARFATRFLALGLHPGGGHTWMLRRAIGAQGAMAALLLDQELSGPEAAEAGLAWRCVPDWELMAEALRLASRAAAAPRQVLVQTKQSIKEAADVSSYADAVELELPRQLWSAQQGEFAARLAKLGVGQAGQG
jgi:enoyl-CoA hydratase